ncbi:hypothetical protein [Phenylobacterium sp.]|uniref:hypothetical protein n=1 Tax=Phenylobacterium sp. TaxID=1871053 RepID=UPI003983632A
MRRHPSLLPLVVALAVAAGGPGQATTLKSTDKWWVHDWGWFTAEPSFAPGRLKITVEVAEIRRTSGGGRTPTSHYWVLEKTERRTDRPDRRQWVDGRTCAALTRAMVDLARLPAVSIQVEPPPIETDSHGNVLLPVPPLDGVVVVIDAPTADYGRLRIEGTSAVGAWVEGTLEKVAPCWRDEAPTLDR